MTESRVVITAVATRAIDEFRRFRAEATNALDEVSKSGGVIGNVVGAVTAALSVAAFTGWIKGAIDATDAASDLSQQTGVAVEDLAGLELALQMGGMEASALGGTMSKLSKEIVGGNAAFERLGVKTKDATGQLKSSKDMLYELADKFAGMEEGVQKVALAQEIFGKSGAAMLPVLNGGAEGLREMDEMARKLGLSLSQEAVDKAGDFNDTLDLLMLGTQGVARGVAAELLPTLSTLTGQFLTTMTSGEKLKNTAAFLATGLRILYTVGAGVVEVFSTVGKTLGAAAAQIVAILQGNFSMASQIGRQWLEEVGDGWKGTLTSIEAAWASATDSSVESMVNFTKHSTVVGLSAAELAEQSKKAAKAHADEAKVLAELAGLTGSFAQEWDQLGALYAKGRISLEQLTKAQADLLAKQPAMKNALAAEAKARDELTDFEKKYAEAVGMTAGLLAERVKHAEDEANRNEELAAAYGMAKSAIEALELARLEEQLAQRATLGLTLEEIENLEKLIGVKRRNAAAIDAMEQVDAAKKAQEEWKRAAESIEQSLTDALLRGFESGKSFGKNLVDTLKNMFSTLVLRPVIQGVVQSGMSMGASAVGMGNVGGSAVGSAGSMLSSISSAGSIYGAYQSSALGQFMSGMSGSASYASQALGAPMTSAAQAGSATASGLGAGGATPWLGMAGGGLAAYQVGEKYGAVAGGVAGAGTIAAGGALTGALAGSGAMAGATAALAAVPVWGWVAIAALSILGGMQKGPEQNTRLTFGSNNQAGNISINERGNEGKVGQSYIDGSSSGAFGSFGVVSSFWMNAAQPAVQDFIKSVTATDDALAQFMSDTEKAAVKAAVTAQKVVSNSGAEGSDPNGMGGLDKVFSERIKTIFNTLEPGLDSLLAGFKGNSQELGIEATALLQYRTALAQSGETLFGAKVTLQELAALKQPTEAVSAAVARITSQFELTNAVAASLGKTAAEAFGAAGLESLVAREKFVTAAGGFSSLAANAEGFARDFLTDAERNAPVLKMVTEQMQALGFAGVDTRDEFKRVVMGLDLTTDGGVKTYAELMNVAAAFAQVYPVIDQAAIAAKELADAQARANEIADERRGLQERLDAMLMTTDQLREKEIAKLDESNQALLRQIFAIEDSRTALEAQAQAQRDAAQAAKDRGADLLDGVDSAFSALQSVVGREKALLQESANAHRALSSALQSALGGMNASGRELEDRTSAQAQIQTALAVARASGTLPDVNGLRDALAVLSKDSSSLFATQEDYLLDLYATRNGITDLAGLTDDALSVEEQSLKALDELVNSAQREIDALKGIDTSILSLAEAISGVDRAIAAAKADPVASAGGELNKLYRELLGRAVDSTGLAFYSARMAEGVTLAEIRAAIMQSDEYQGYQAKSGRKIPAFANGGDHAGGLRLVGEYEPEIEATGPSRIHTMRDLVDSLRNPSDNNAVLVAAVDRLTTENATMRRELNEALYAIAKYTMETKDTLDKWEVVGQPEIRKDVKQDEEQTA